MKTFRVQQAEGCGVIRLCLFGAHKRLFLLRFYTLEAKLFARGRAEEGEGEGRE